MGVERDGLGRETLKAPGGSGLVPWIRKEELGGFKRVGQARLEGLRGEATDVRGEQ